MISLIRPWIGALPPAPQTTFMKASVLPAAPGVIDLRITRGGWARVRDRFGDDAAVRRDPARRDWIELHLDSTTDVGRLGALLAAAVEANAG